MIWQVSVKTDLILYILCYFPQNDGSNQIKAQNKVVSNLGYAPDTVSLPVLPDWGKQDGLVPSLGS